MAETWDTENMHWNVEERTFTYHGPVDGSGWIESKPEDFCAECGRHGQEHGPHSDQVQHDFVHK